MPSNSTTIARNRLVEATLRVDEVKKKAADVIKEAVQAVELAASRKASWQLVEQLIKRTFATLGASSYLWISAVGLTYSFAFYLQFEGLNIFSFFVTSDFLLGAFGNVGILTVAAIVTFGSLIALQRQLKNVSLGQAYSRSDKKNSEDPLRKAFRTFRYPALFTFLFPFVGGYLESHFAVKHQSPSVRVTVNDDSNSRFSNLLRGNETILLGTTSNFHFFFQCVEAPEQESESCPYCLENSCGIERTFVVPNASIISMEFLSSPVDEGRETIPLATRIVDLKSAVDQLRVVLESFVGYVTDTNDYRPVLTAIGGVDRKIDQVLDGIEGRLDSQATLRALNDVNAKIDAVLKIVPGPIDRLIAELGKAEYIQSITGNLTDLDRDIFAISGNLTTLMKNVGSIDGKMGSIAGALTTLQRRLDDLVQKVDLIVIAGSQTGCVGSFQKVGIVGPFEPGSHDVIEEKGMSLQEELECIVQEFKTDVPLHTMFVGRIDIARLDDSGRTRYVTDGGLAKDRAAWVQREISNRASNNQLLVSAIERGNLISAGPLHLNEPDETDRRVDVWACWSEEKASLQPSCIPPAFQTEEN